MSVDLGLARSGMQTKKDFAVTTLLKGMEASHSAPSARGQMCRMRQTSRCRLM